jgi:hypothetical protein
MSGQSIYRLGDVDTKKRMNFYSATKNMDHCGPQEKSRVRVCKPKFDCHDVVTTCETHIEKCVDPCEKPCPDPCPPKHCPEPCEKPCEPKKHCGSGYGYSSIGYAVLWFIIIAVIVWLIIFSLRPAWALDEDGNVDTGRVLLASIVIALIIVIIVYIIYAACGSYGYGY